MEAAKTAVEILSLFAGDLLADGEVSPDVTKKAIDIALTAGLSAVPDEIDVDGTTIPMGAIVGVLRPLVAAGINALIEATKPVRAIVNNPASVTGRIHD